MAVSESYHLYFKDIFQGVPGGSVVKNLLANAGDKGWIPLIGEDPTCHGTTKPMRHSYWPCALEPRSLTDRAHVLLLQTKMPGACALQQGRPLQWEACSLQLESGPHSPQLEKSLCSSEDPAQPQINEWSYFKMDTCLWILWNILRGG